jgi:DNA-binding response OmpR family regulator
MKKILIAGPLHDLVSRDNSFLNRAEVTMLSAPTKEEAFDIHKTEKVNLIVMELDLPAMTCEEFCAAVRANSELRQVSIIVVCQDKRSAMERSSKCQANAWMTRPLDERVFLDKAHQLLNISARQDYRVLLSVVVTSNVRKKSFFCRSENISSSGMLLETDKLLSRGDRVVCSFYLPDSAQILAEGEIVRIVKRTTDVEPNQYGLRFTSIRPEAKVAIEEFVRHKSKILRY